MGRSLTGCHHVPPEHGTRTSPGRGPPGCLVVPGPAAGWVLTACHPWVPGVNCEVNPDDCASDPCVHGVCQDGIGRYDCVCQPGFTGGCSAPSVPIGCSAGFGVASLLSGCHHGAVTHGKGLAPARPWVPVWRSRGTHQPLLGVAVLGAHVGCPWWVLVVITPLGASVVCPHWVLVLITCVGCCLGCLCWVLLLMTPFGCPRWVPLLIGHVDDPSWVPRLVAYVGCPCWMHTLGAPVGCPVDHPHREPPLGAPPTWVPHRHPTPRPPGPRCNVEINECASNPCQDGGTCVDGANGFTCLCPPGTRDAQCRPGTLPCHSSPCAHGTCRDHGEGFSCECDPGWGGPTCAQRGDACASRPCRHGGTCTPLGGGYRCACRQGYQGTVGTPRGPPPTSHPLIMALWAPMGAGGGRTQGAGCPLAASRALMGDRDPAVMVAPCRVLVAPMGRACEVVLAPCAPNPCDNGGTCAPTADYGGFTCRCPPGWQAPLGPPLQHPWVPPPVPHPRILLGTLGCPHPPWLPPSHPLDTLGCPPSTLGSFPPSHIRMSLWAPLGAPSTHGCPHPLPPSGEQCQEDVDECGASPCQHGGTCANRPGTFGCLCPPGYGGAACEHDLDDCDPGEWGPPPEGMGACGVGGEGLGGLRGHMGVLWSGGAVGGLGAFWGGTERGAGWASGGVGGMGARFGVPRWGAGGVLGCFGGAHWGCFGGPHWGCWGCFGVPFWGTVHI
ncbi:NOTCH3 isoform 3 [Aix galericulata]|nr:NOTCH3 isoform 3 [Aix galericulata]